MSLNSGIVVSFVIILGGFVTFVLNSGHVLTSLLSLEMMGVGVYLSVVSVLIILGLDYCFGLYYLLTMVVEGAVGLSLLVAVSNSLGGDSASAVSLLC